MLCIKIKRTYHKIPIRIKLTENIYSVRFEEKNKKTGKNLEGRIGEKWKKRETWKKTGNNGEKRREKGRKEENSNKKEGKSPIVSLFNIGPYNRIKNRKEILKNTKGGGIFWSPLYTYTPEAYFDLGLYTSWIYVHMM